MKEIGEGRASKVIYQLGRWRVVSRWEGDVVKYYIEYLLPDSMGEASWRLLSVIGFTGFGGPSTDAFLFDLLYDLEMGNDSVVV